MLEFHGLAVPYNVSTRLNSDSYRTIFAPGAFSASIRSPRIEAWLNHRPAAVIARRRDHEIGLHEDATGLYYFIRISGRVWSDILTDAAGLGQVHGASIGWDPESVRATWIGDCRVITAAALVEVSLCINRTHPQFPGTHPAITRGGVATAA